MAYWDDPVSGVATAADVPIINRWVKDLDRYYRLSAEADSNPIVTTYNKQPVGNPLYTLALKILASIERAREESGVAGALRQCWRVGEKRDGRGPRRGKTPAIWDTTGCRTVAGCYLQNGLSRHSNRSVSSVWSTWLRLAGEKCDPLTAVIKRTASSRTLRLVSCERHVRTSNARSAVMP